MDVAGQRGRPRQTEIRREPAATSCRLCYVARVLPVRGNHLADTSKPAFSIPMAGRGRPVAVSAGDCGSTGSQAAAMKEPRNRYRRPGRWSRDRARSAWNSGRGRRGRSGRRVALLSAAVAVAMLAAFAVLLHDNDKPATHYPPPDSGDT